MPGVQKAAIYNVMDGHHYPYTTTLTQTTQTPYKISHGFHPACYTAYTGNISWETVEFPSLRLVSCDFEFPCFLEKHYTAKFARLPQVTIWKNLIPLLV